MQNSKTSAELKTIETDRLVERLESLYINADSSGMTDWELEFVGKMYDTRQWAKNFSVNQKEKIEQIAAKYL